MPATSVGAKDYWIPPRFVSLVYFWRVWSVFFYFSWQESTESLSGKGKALSFLKNMGYTMEEASIAMERCGTYSAICFSFVCFSAALAFCFFKWCLSYFFGYNVVLFWKHPGFGYFTLPHVSFPYVLLFCIICHHLNPWLEAFYFAVWISVVAKHSTPHVTYPWMICLSFVEKL